MKIRSLFFLIIIVLFSLAACDSFAPSGPIVVTPTETNSPLMDMILEGEGPTATQASGLPTLTPDLVETVESTQVVELMADQPQEDNGDGEAEADPLSSPTAATSPSF